VLDGFFGEGVTGPDDAESDKSSVQNTHHAGLEYVRTRLYNEQRTAAQRKAKQYV
jgi:hypothetical protein